MNPNDMILQECLDWLAKDDGWFLAQNDPWPMVIWKHTEKESGGHPYPPTLDAIAGAMPRGWRWERCTCEELLDIEVGWRAYRHGHSWQHVSDTGDEKLDRARLAVACRMAEQNKE